MDESSTPAQCTDDLVGRVHVGDCLDVLPSVTRSSIDLILADLPYGTTRNHWDSVIDLATLWQQYERIIKPHGTIALTAAQPFASVLVTSNLRLFRYEWIWAKTIGSGQLNAKRQPLRVHESILVFYKKPGTYNAHMTEGSPYKVRRTGSAWTGRGYNAQRDHIAENTGTRVPKSVLSVANPRIRGGHPTQKPLELFEYLISTYTNPGDVVLDNVLGSGTTAIAAERLGRAWVGMELDPQYAAMANARIAAQRRTAGAEAI